MAGLFFEQFLFKFLTAVFGVWIGISSVVSGTGKELPKAPECFTPVLRFAVTSDVHLDGDPEQAAAKRLADLFADSYAYAESCEYKGLDAVIVAGDFATSGADKEYELFNSIVNENIREGTELITVLGNHEFISYRDEDPTVTYDAYKRNMGQDVDRHLVINGYHFIACSYSDDGKTFNSKKEWLTAELDAATAQDKNKPVFVVQHPHPFATVFGSVNWGDLTVRSIYSKYPQIVDFSGHSHYSISDPRAIWQGSFTAVNTGSLSALMSNRNYIHGDEDAPGESGAFWIVEADEAGNIRLMAYDIVSHMFFEKNDYYLTDVAKASAHRYTWGNMKSADTAPEFPDGAQITAEKDDVGNTVLVFPKAEGYWGAGDYKICVSAGSKDVYADTVISNYVRADAGDMRVDIGAVESGTYSVKIMPYSPYAKGGKSLTGSVTV